MLRANPILIIPARPKCLDMQIKRRPYKFMNHRQLAREGMFWALVLTAIACWLLVVSLRADERIMAPALAPVTGVSMLPMFKAGQFVFIYPCDFKALRSGQPLVWFEQARKINILHIAKKIVVTPKGRAIVTQGLANAEPDLHLADPLNFVGCVDIPSNFKP